MQRGPKQPSRPFTPRFRDKAPRFQRQEATGDESSRSALRALVRLLARQAAAEIMDNSDAPAVH